MPVQDGPLKCVAFAGGDTPADNTINDRTYDHTVRFRGTVGTTDKWMVSGGPHIYHIHVNPFQIADIWLGKVSIYNADGSCKDKVGTKKVDPQYCGQRGVFRDTLMINPQYTAVLLSKYEDFDGHFVIHCHILDHEDAGMMAEVELVRPGMKVHAAAGHAAMAHMGRMR